MLSAPVIPMEFTAPRKTRWVPLALSLLLHLLLALAWLGFPMPEMRKDEEPTITVELAPRPEPSKPKISDAPLGETKGEAAVSEAKPIPQLEDGALAKQSSPPKPNAGPSPPAPRAEAVLKPKKPEPVTQNERDFVLSQVIRHWHPPRELAAYDKADVHVGVIVDAQGYFDDDFDARRPWNPAGVFEGYNGLHPQSVQRRSVDAFYQAIRKAQPVRLPPALKVKAPFPVRLDFRFKDAR
ncbi:MAG: hypothetical protein H7Z12_01815 [Rhodospirillaceae bacterium]|nr:hypothetical protein [Rhodospirillales bacterium]